VDVETADEVGELPVVDRLVHHAEGLILQGDSCRLKDRTKEVTLPDSHQNAQFSTGHNRASFRPALRLVTPSPTT
jgi:hypothetical protein